MLKIKQNEIYAQNVVDHELIEAVKDLAEKYDVVEVNFNVTGRTMHQLLAQQLIAKLDHKEYDADIEYWMYICRIYKIR